MTTVSCVKSVLYSVPSEYDCLFSHQLAIIPSTKQEAVVIGDFAPFVYSFL